jgi:hypothetical protein
MDDISYFERKKQFGLRERGKRIDNGEIFGKPVGGSANPGASIGDMYDMRYINNDEIPPEHVFIDKLDFLRVLRKEKKISIKPKRKPVKKCRCKK